MFAPGQNTLFHPLARMLPLHRYQSQVYRLAEKFPPGLRDGYAPIWEVVPFVLTARSTQQARVNFQREFHLLAVTGSATSNVNGGFRAQFYDPKRRYQLSDGRWARGRRMSERGVGFNQLCGGPGQPFFLREPYALLEKNAQIIVVCQNYETVTNTIQIVLYGVARRFNFPS